MAVVAGTLLVLVTWLVALLVLISLGLLPTVFLNRSTSVLPLLRMSLWWGLLIALIFSVMVSLWVPLGGPTPALLGIATIGTLGTLGWIALVRRRPGFVAAALTPGRVVLGFTILAVTVYLAVAALGPVTNYDSGLYHLGAIRYASEFSAIPGLANVYFPFGYGTTHFTLAALLTNGPWGIEGFRLVNGLILTMAGTELLARYLQRTPGPGFYVLAVGMTATWVPMVALSDYWVTSPSQDSAALTLTVVASAYLTDAVSGRKHWLAAASSVIIIATSLTLIRPTLGAYLVGALGILAILFIRRDVPGQRWVPPALIALGAGVLALAAATARDRILSGWFQYPLSVFAFDVPWRADDPAPVRLATLGFHRNPDDLWGSIEGWNWVRPWLIDRATQWETYELLALAIATIVVIAVAVRRAPRARLPRRILLATAPSALAVIVWWAFTPPSYRFAWGALFTLFTVPLGWSLWSLTSQAKTEGQQALMTANVTLVVLATPVLGVVAYSALFRLDVDAMTDRWDVNIGLSIPVAVAQVPSAPVEAITVGSQLQLLQPVESDQCWWTYPLCTPAPDPRLATLDGPWPSGFTID